MCSASLRDNRSYSTKVMQWKAEILKISQIDNVLAVLEAPILITKWAELWVKRCSLEWRLVMCYVFPVGVALYTPRQCQMHVGRVPWWKVMGLLARCSRGPGVSHAELLTPQNAACTRTYTLIHGICTGADSCGAVWLFLLPTAQLICRWETQDST